MAELTHDIRETVRDRYAEAAKAAKAGGSGCCGSASLSCSPADETGAFGASLHD